MVALLALLLAVPGSYRSSAAPNDDPQVRLETAPASGAYGDLFTTIIAADHIISPGLSAWQTTVTFDPAILAVDSVTFGSDLGSTGRFFGDIGPDLRVDDITLAQFSYGSGDGPVGDGIHLATIVWRGVGGGTSLLDVNESILLDTEAGDLTPVGEVDDEIEVTPAPYRFRLPLIFKR